MTTIKASCPACGDVTLSAGDITLRVCDATALSHYCFPCPRCGTNVVKPTDDHIVRLLQVSGVPAVSWNVPAEARQARAGPALTYDDLLDFLVDLSASDLVAGAAGVPHRL